MAEEVKIPISTAHVIEELNKDEYSDLLELFKGDLDENGERGAGKLIKDEIMGYINGGDTFEDVDENIRGTLNDGNKYIIAQCLYGHMKWNIVEDIKYWIADIMCTWKNALPGEIGIGPSSGGRDYFSLKYERGSFYLLTNEAVHKKMVEWAKEVTGKDNEDDCVKDAVVVSLNNYIKEHNAWIDPKFAVKMHIRGYWTDKYKGWRQIDQDIKAAGVPIIDAYAMAMSSDNTKKYL